MVHQKKEKKHDMKKAKRDSSYHVLQQQHGAARSGLNCLLHSAGCGASEAESLSVQIRQPQPGEWHTVRAYPERGPMQVANPRAAFLRGQGYSLKQRSGGQSTKTRVSQGQFTLQKLL